ncbi:MAG: NAD-dependent epimerase/dehydratase family protein [Bacteroidota bacterium]
MSTTPTRALVTGATGMVGAFLCHRLARNGVQVRALRRASSRDHVLRRAFSSDPHLLSSVEWFEGDILDPVSLRDAMEGMDQVYHAAAIVSFDPADRERIHRVNVVGTTHVVDMALDAGVKSICHVSSVAALGRVEEDAFLDENVPWKNSRNNTDYAKSKYAAEREVWRGFEEGLRGVILNPTVILGPADWHAGSGLLFKTVWNGLRFFPEGTNGFVDVRDVADSAVRLLQADVHAERFILCSENLPYRQLFSWIAENIGKRPPSVRISRSVAEVAWRLDWLASRLPGRRPFLTREMARTSTRRWNYSNDKIRSTIGVDFIPMRTSIADWSRVFLDTYPS